MYLARNGHIYELYWAGGDTVRGWDIMPPGSPPPTGNLAACYSAGTNTKHVFYRSAGGELHEIWWDGQPLPQQPRHINLTQIFGAPLAKDRPAAFTVEGPNTQHVAYRGTDNHIYELKWVPAQPMVTPARTLFIAKSWSPGADPKVFFTTIADALAQAATMTPAQGDPVAIVIFPGTYNEDIVLQSWVFLSSGSTEQNAVRINGTVRWAPTGAGPPPVFEAVQLYFLNILRPTTVTTAGKGMTGGQASFILHGCFVDGLEVNGRSASGNARDFVFAATSVPGPNNPFTLNSCLFEWVAGRLNGMTFDGDCLFRIIGSTQVPYNDPTDIKGWFVNGTSKGICTGDNFRADDPTIGWTLGRGTSVVFGGCSLSALKVEAGATADIRSSECPDLSLSGPGEVSRRSLTTSFGPTVPGANPVKFNVPFPPDPSYNVSLQLTAGPGNAAVTTSGKTGAGFTINDAVGGNTYDVTVIHD